MKFFKRKSALDRQLEELEKIKIELRNETIKNQESTLSDIEGLMEAYKMMKDLKVRRFDNFFNLCIISSIASSDILLLTHQIALSNHKLEKLLSARILAMVSYEFLHDINDLLGKKLIQEIRENNFEEFIPTLQQVNSQFAVIRKKHSDTLRIIRNNTAAHKNKNALDLINLIYGINTKDIMDMGTEITLLNSIFTKESTKIIYKILDDAKEKYYKSLS